MDIDYFRLIQIVFMVTVALCGLYGGDKVRQVSHKTLMYLDQSKRLKQAYYIAIALLLVFGILFAFIIGVLSFLDSLNIYTSFLWFALMAFATSFFCYTSYKLAQ